MDSVTVPELVNVIKNIDQLNEKQSKEIIRNYAYGDYDSGSGKTEYIVRINLKEDSVEDLILARETIGKKKPIQPFEKKLENYENLKKNWPNNKLVGGTFAAGGIVLIAAGEEKKYKATGHLGGKLNEKESGGIFLLFAGAALFITAYKAYKTVCKRLPGERAKVSNIKNATHDFIDNRIGDIQSSQQIQANTPMPGNS